MQTFIDVIQVIIDMILLGMLGSLAVFVGILWGADFIENLFKKKWPAHGGVGCAGQQKEVIQGMKLYLLWV